MKRAPLISVLALAFGLSRPALADEGARAQPPLPTPAPAARSFTESHEWGWLLIGTSLALGAALSATGLAEECQGDHDCRVEKSQLFWGGLGVASTGSMVGFIILGNAREFDATHPESASGWTLELGGTW